MRAYDVAAPCAGASACARVLSSAQAGVAAFKSAASMAYMAAYRVELFVALAVDCSPRTYVNSLGLGVEMAPVFSVSPWDA